DETEESPKRAFGLRHHDSSLPRKPPAPILLPLPPLRGERVRVRGVCARNDCVFIHSFRTRFSRVRASSDPVTTTSSPRAHRPPWCRTSPPEGGGEGEIWRSAQSAPSTSSGSPKYSSRRSNRKRRARRTAQIPPIIPPMRGQTVTAKQKEPSTRSS